MELVLEVNRNRVKDDPPINGCIMITPPINKDYWCYRVKLYKDQAVLGFPKFGQIGIGMAQEEDWNTNLPSHCSTVKILNHIKKNKKYKCISDGDIFKAIKMIKEAIGE